MGDTPLWKFMGDAPLWEMIQSDVPLYGKCPFMNGAPL